MFRTLNLQRTCLGQDKPLEKERGRERERERHMHIHTITPQATPTRRLRRRRRRHTFRSVFKQQMFILFIYFRINLIIICCFEYFLLLWIVQWWKFYWRLHFSLCYSFLSFANVAGTVTLSVMFFGAYLPQQYLLVIFFILYFSFF